MVAIDINGKITVFSELPKTWGNILNYPKSGNAYADGFRNVIEVNLTEDDIKGDIYFDEGLDAFTYNFTSISDEAKLAKIKGINEGRREVLLQEKLANIVLAEANSVSDNDAVDIQELFPFWKAGLSVVIGEKYQDFDGTEIKLYKVVQSHNTQTGWEPKNVPALFTRVAKVDEVLDWVQPTGAQDAYNIGDKVKFNGSTYESIINANTWSPTVYPQGWSLIG